MATEIKVPALGESVTEATVAKWFKKAGDAVAVDEPLCELETDKVTVEVNAIVAGAISAIIVAEGETVSVGGVLCVIAEGAAQAPAKAQATAAPKTAPAAAAAVAAGIQPMAGVMSPAARKLADEKGVAPAVGSGKDGRVTKQDVMDAAPTARPAAPSVPAVPPVAAGPRANAAREERVRMSRLRLRIAQRLKEAQNNAAMLTTFNEVDMTALLAMRERHKDEFEKKHGARLGFMSFFVKACIAALKEIPAVNAEIEGDEVVYKNYYDIGVAVGTPQGLVVPVVRDADKLSFAGVEKAIGELGRKARDGKLAMADLTGGTFTISNGGVYGSLMSTPILNPPQSGILGMHKIQQRPMAVGSEIKLRPMMYLALSYDHRLVDGREAVTFLVRVKDCIEDPERLLLEVCEMADAYDLIVIGSGPGGYVAAIRAAQLGMKVACVEKRATLGGTCLNVGCIPSKALLQSTHLYEEAGHDLAAHGISVGALGFDLAAMQKRKADVVNGSTRGIEFLFKKNKVAWLKGAARIDGPGQLSVIKADGSADQVAAKNILIASGSESTPLPGVEIDEKQIVTSTGALELANVPKRLVVIGAGIIGLELGSVWRRLGAEVTMVEFLDRIAPGLDGEIVKHLQRILAKQGLKFRLGTKVTGAKKGTTGVSLSLQAAAGGNDETLEADVVLVCIGRRAHLQGLGLDKAGVSVSKRGRIEVDGKFQTNVPGIYAIGDAIEGPMLAHKASEEGVICVEMMAGQSGHIDHNKIPSVLYTQPEVATVGRTEEQLKEAGIAYKLGKYPFSADPRSRANNRSEGFVKVLADAKTDEVLGVHILGAEAGTMIAEAAMAMEYRASAEDIGRICHAHPTVSEAMKEAALAAWDKPIHI